MRREFRTKLLSKGPGGAWTYLAVPFDVQNAFGSKARVPVQGTINGYAFRNSLMPEGDATHSMMVSRELQAGAQAGPGNTVRVSLARDTAERAIEVPDDLRRALGAARKAGAFFNGITHAQKKAYVDWIGSAQQAATRAGRIRKSVEMLLAGKKNARCA